MIKKALIVIDIQNDYFAGGAYPLHQTEVTVKKNLDAMAIAQSRQIPIIHVQHFVSPEFGDGLFFYDDTFGAEIHQEIMAAAPNAPVILKRHADCFEKTNLDSLLQELDIEEILITGMMTHNCVIHTALSPAAAKYRPKVIEECTCTTDPITHALAVDAMQVRGIDMITIEAAFD
ncbi:cysteine hydrolase family protein [Pseudoalteromonas luteoviolacea]|uniref:cysteine hydrolase family protein n=1 Tax=Pseudoalteromonas luteoviolacea TaxID=43657 RepID=UPI00115261F6|nr:isochorismatase family cysteine hydrolase [Pseudoalteromonas luteoviolacea]TQF67799.1 cysteine hydrolase [Pseudoalteromonas luteoviolacea]